MTTNHIRVPGSLTDVDTNPRCKVGTFYRDQSTGTGYVYVYNAGADTWAAGEVVGVHATTPTFGYADTTAATMLDYDDAGDIVSHVAGIGLSSVATTKYGWLWCHGPSATHTITTDGTLAAGDGLVLDDGLSVATTEVETQDHGNFGYAHAADSDANVLTGATLRNTAFYCP